MSDYESFEALSAAQRDWVEASKRAKKQDGLARILSSLYPDQAHFIYELLQNAEDQGASTVEFTVSQGQLSVTHDGPTLFTLDDIESITGIGESTKTTDSTKIGKFGVGFKAVFAYTTRPEIRSGEYSFAIEDLFVPVKIPGVAEPGTTTFTFPFDRHDKTADIARAEVDSGLADLGNATLLFLKNIHRISFLLSDGQRGVIQRQDLTAQIVHISTTAGRQVDESHWLRLEGPASVQRDDGALLTVAAAFQLQVDDEMVSKRGKKESLTVSARSEFTIVPITRGEVSIYFPAAKESSGLHFNIHAPFASTVARDSVRDDPDNVRLIDDIAAAIVTALPKLRDEGLLSDSFLAALPNDEDPLGHPYGRIRSVITEAFNTLEVTPAWGTGGGYAPARSLVSSPSEFRNWLDPNDLPFLFELAEFEVDRLPRWIRDRDGRAGKFLAGLDTIPFGWDRLDRCLEGADHFLEESDPVSPQWFAWLEAKSDPRIIDLYQLIGRGKATYQLRRADLRSAPLVRLRRRGTMTHVKGSETYLPSGPDDTNKSRVPVELAYFEDDEDQARASNLKAFYTAVGVKRWNQTTKIERRLAAYAKRKAPYPDGDDLKRHLEDVEAFVRFGLASPSTAAQIFAKEPFLLAAQSDGAWRWATPAETFVDLPFRDTGLTTLYPRVPLHWKNEGGYAYDREPYALAGIYLEVDGIEDFLKIVGARVGVEIVPVDVATNPQFSYMWKVNNRPNSNGKNIDWGIDRLDEVIASGDADLLRTLWSTVVAAPRSKADAAFQANGRAPRYTFESQLVQTLKSSAWVLDRNGDLKAPKDLTLDELPEDWDVPPSTSLVHKLDFGLEDDKLRLEAEGVTAFLKQQGLEEDVDLVREARDLGLSTDDIRSMIRERAAALSFPKGASSDPERRAAAAAAAASQAPLHRTETRPRTVVVERGLASAETRSYLRHHYTDDSGTMFCQACQEPMPFRKKDGQWYFEAVRFVTARKHVLTSNAIALCPLCAALYNHSRETKNDALIDQLSSLEIAEGQGTVDIPVVLNSKRVTIVFTGKHAIDLQAALGTAGDER